MNSIVVHYQEIALKGKNRPWFLGRLVRNLSERCRISTCVDVRALMGRIEIVLGPGASREEAGEPRRGARSASRTFRYAAPHGRSTST